MKFFFGIQNILYTNPTFVLTQSMGDTLKQCRFTKSQNHFDNFKVNKTYREILEHVTEAQGSSYLEILRSRNDLILEVGLRTVLVSDFVGNPIKYSYPGISIRLSPTTLRYLKLLPTSSYCLETT